MKNSKMLRSRHYQKGCIIKYPIEIGLTPHQEEPIMKSTKTIQINRSNPLKRIMENKEYQGKGL